MRVIYGIDWLQLHVIAPPRLGSQKMGAFSLKKWPHGNNLCKEMYDISYKGNEVAHLSVYPHSSKLHPQMGILKILNGVLYTNVLSEVTALLLAHLNLSFKGITRADVYADFNVFNNGLKPQHLIQRFMRNEYIKKGSKMKFGNHGHTGDRSHKFETLSFGQESGYVRYNLYDKTKEMKERKHKPYIIETWKQAELDIDNVWRLEFMLRSRNMTFINSLTAEKKTFHTLDWLLKEFQFQVFQYCLMKYWRWSRHKSVVRRDRLKELNLFPKTELYFEAIIHEAEKDVSKFDKAMLVKMVKMDALIRDRHGSVAAEAFGLVINDIIERGNLQEWAKSKDLYQ